MQAPAIHYPDWKAPSSDGQTLVWPEPAELIADTRANHRAFSSAETLLQGVPLREVRLRMREFVGHPDEQPLVANGHQSELYHAGVWAKNALIDVLASKVNGLGYHISVDTDAPKHLNVRWPGESLPISDDAALNRAAWTGLVAAPTPAHLNTLSEALQSGSAGWGFKPMLPELLASLRKLALEPTNLAASLANAMHELDWGLGLNHHVLMASPIWQSDPFLLFAHELLSNADVVAKQYNEALQSYRDGAGIRSQMRPMPDLLISEDAVEIPFWLDDLHTGQRYRPSLFRDEAGWILQQTDGQTFLFEKNISGWEAANRLRTWLNSNRLRLAPRALTLTMFCRLFLADQFVHGIGGARYDQVTDRFITMHYNIAPPKFAVTTATLFFPEALGVERICLPCVLQEGHRLRHELLGEQKREMVAKIDALPRGSVERSTQYFEMHGALSAAVASSEQMSRWRDRLDEAEHRQRREETLFDRELFYGIQPKDRLVSMIEQYRRIG